MSWVDYWFPRSIQIMGFNLYALQDLQPSFLWVTSYFLLRACLDDLICPTDFLKRYTETAFLKYLSKILTHVILGAAADPYCLYFHKVQRLNEVFYFLPDKSGKSGKGNQWLRNCKLWVSLTICLADGSPGGHSLIKSAFRNILSFWKNRVKSCNP